MAKAHNLWSERNIKFQIQNQDEKLMLNNYQIKKKIQIQYQNEKFKLFLSQFSKIIHSFIYLLIYLFIYLFILKTKISFSGSSRPLHLAIHR